MAIKITNKLVDVIVNGKLDKATEAMDSLISQKEIDLTPFSVLGKQLMDVGRYELASRVFAKWIEMQPERVMPWSNLGACLHKLRLTDNARDVLMHAISLDPKNVLARINLGGVLQELKDHKAALDNALEAIKCDPTSSLAFNNLGTALTDNGMALHAKHAFETSLMLDPNSQFARINLAKTNSLLNIIRPAIEEFEKALAHEEKTKGLMVDLIKAHLALDYFRISRLKKGWEYYEAGFSPHVPKVMSRHPQRQFSVPRWQGQQLTDSQRLLIWREQGIGDEILFSTMLHEIKSAGGNIIVETDERLVSSYQRSFPEFLVRPQSFDPDTFTTELSDFDFQIPMASLGQFYRNKIEDFARGGAFIKIDPVQKEKFAERLKPYANLRKIGFAWRSGMLSATRNNNYSSLVDWGPLFSLPNTVFVNLQYGESEEEILEAERLQGIKILRWPDLDLKDDLDSVFALISCLDVVVSSPVAVFPMAGAVGTPAIQISGPHWATFGSATHYPWFPGARITGKRGKGPIAGELEKVPGLIEDMLSAS